MNKLILSIGIALGAMSAQAQVVNIPDANFLKALITIGVDSNNDNLIQMDEAEAITSLNISNSSILDLKGIEAFSNIINLNCSSNQISSLDLNKNIKLEFLQCQSNQIDTLNMNNNSSLTLLWCFNNQLSSLSIENNSNLDFLHCADNNLTKLSVNNNIKLTKLCCLSNYLTSLDVSHNIKLFTLVCSYNLLTFLDVRNNNSLIGLVCDSNEFLSQICINEEQLAKTNDTPIDWVKDPTATWSTTCATGIEEDKLLHTNKTLLRILTPLGQELQPEQAIEGLYIYQYSDGSTRKVMKQN